MLASASFTVANFFHVLYPVGFHQYRGHCVFLTLQADPFSWYPSACSLSFGLRTTAHISSRHSHYVFLCLRTFFLGLFRKLLTLLVSASRCRIFFCRQRLYGARRQVTLTSCFCPLCAWLARLSPPLLLSPFL